MTKKKELTEIVLLVDESGSMKSLQRETVSNINKFVEEQKAVKGMARLSLVTFATPKDRYYTSKRETMLHYLSKSKNIQEISQISNEDYNPDNGTPLFDSIAEAILNAEKHNESLKGCSVSNKKASKYIIAIITDGQENHSRLYSKEKISKLVKYIVK